MANQRSSQNAFFAGGCFWCMEKPFEELDGVIDVLSGYANGTGESPIYKDYAQKGFVEAIQVTYNPSKVSYKELLDVFWRQIDPTDADGQFVDRGPQYRSEIFYSTSQEQEVAHQSKKELERFKRFSKSIVTQIVPFKNFYKAEEYHQDYAKKNPLKYRFYRSRSGRDQFLNKHWNQSVEKKKKSIPNKSTNFKKPSDAELRKLLTPLQYNVTQKEATEPPFANEYNDNKEPGIYVDIVSSEPLFSSLDKFDSKTGWPSFTQPLEQDNIVERKDRTLLFLVRTEVRSKHADSHLGHVFKDGPPPTGLRYCINSAALRFIPVADLEKEGYGQYKKLFNVNP